MQSQHIITSTHNENNLLKNNLHLTRHKNIFAYSDIKITQNQNRIFNIITETNSASASGKSKGGLFVSAKVEI